MTEAPWYRRTYRWAQTNLVEIDPARYDGDWWRRHWRDTAVQGVIVNAGGIVTYYPSRFPLAYRAVALGDRDLYGEIVAAAREEGLTVLARMDSNRVAEDFVAAHPDWICRDADGNPRRAADRYLTCVNSPYYDEYLPAVLTEVIERSRPDGFADNSWAGLPRSSICYCRYCAAGFADATGLELPRRHDWAADAYRAWIAWNYRRRVELWDANNRVTTAAGGPDCRWLGMVSGDLLNNCARFVDLRRILSRSEIVLLDHQRRNTVDGFEQNTEVGLRLHELAGWDRLIPESTPQYQNAVPAFRAAAMPEAEVRLWATAGFAGGIQPWWHHIGSSHDDRRQYRTAAPLFGWHRDNLDVQVDRTPVADVGVVWSAANHDAVGRDRAAVRTLDPYRGVVTALTAAGIGYLPVHADDLDRAAGRFRAIVLPNLAALSDDQAAAIEAYVAAGGSVVATGETGRYDEAGTRRPEPALGRLFGLRFTGAEHGGWDAADAGMDTQRRHTYLRLSPEVRAGVDGPRDDSAPATGGARHPVLDGFADTDLLPFGGYLPVADLDEGGIEESDAGIDQAAIDQGGAVLATFVPDFPIFPPETSWMRTPRTGIPAIVVRRRPAGGRLAWLLADVDRCYARDEQPDHGRLIGNAVRWAVGDRPSMVVEAAGLVAATLYRQPDRFVLHLTNRVVTARTPGRQARLVPVGPARVRLRMAGGVPDSAALRVAGTRVPVREADGYAEFTVDRILDHEVAVLDDPAARRKSAAAPAPSWHAVPRGTPGTGRPG